MDFIRKRKDSGIHSKKDKKLKKLINKSDSESDDSEHELSHYLNDRVKLMKEVLKIIKPKKIKSMAPDCIKKLDNGEINSMLLEELLGISNKRLKYIFHGQNLEEDSSSTDPEVEQQTVDIISLDDITDDDFIIDLDSENDNERKRHKKHVKPKIKDEFKKKKIKKEKQEKTEYSKKSKESGKDKMDEQNLMSVLELLELQARARAIRSQLALENSKKVQEKTEKKTEESDNDDAVIVESPKNIEIVITSSESEHESEQNNSTNQKNSSKHKASLNGNNNNDNEEDNGQNKDNTKESNNRRENSNGSGDEILSNTCLLQVASTSEELTFQNNEPIRSAETSNRKETRIDEPKSNILDGSTALENKKSTDLKNKICNIETIIISPPRSKQNATEKEKSSYSDPKTENISTKNKDPVLLTSKNYDKVENNITEEDSDESQKYEIQNNTLEESDGIIITMEQSEIDCIISD